MNKGRHSDEEMKFIGRRNAENWLVMNAKWLHKLRKGAQSNGLVKGKRTHSLRRRLDAGVDYGVLKRSGTYSGAWWTLTPYAEYLLEEMAG